MLLQPAAVAPPTYASAIKDVLKGSDVMQNLLKYLQWHGALITLLSNELELLLLCRSVSSSFSSTPLRCSCCHKTSARQQSMRSPESAGGGRAGGVGAGGVAIETVGSGGGSVAWMMNSEIKIQKPLKLFPVLVICGRFPYFKLNLHFNTIGLLPPQLLLLTKGSEWSKSRSMSPTSCLEVLVMCDNLHHHLVDHDDDDGNCDHQQQHLWL